MPRGQRKAETLLYGVRKRGPGPGPTYLSLAEIEKFFASGGFITKRRSGGLLVEHPEIAIQSLGYRQELVVKEIKQVGSEFYMSGATISTTRNGGEKLNRFKDLEICEVEDPEYSLIRTALNHISGQL